MYATQLTHGLPECVCHANISVFVILYLTWCETTRLCCTATSRKDRNGNSHNKMYQQATYKNSSFSPDENCLCSWIHFRIVEASAEFVCIATYVNEWGFIAPSLHCAKQLNYGWYKIQFFVSYRRYVHIT